MSRCRIRGSNGDSHASISDRSSGVVELKVFVMLKELLLLLMGVWVFSLGDDPGLTSVTSSPILAFPPPILLPQRELH